MSEIRMSTGSFSSVAIARLAVFREQHLVAFAPQHDRQQLAHRPLVVDDEDARRPAIGGRLDLRGSRRHVVTTDAGRQMHGDRRPAPGLRADLNFAVVVGDDAMDDRQAEAAALDEAAVKRLEQAVELLGRNADAFVAHRDHDAVRAAVDRASRRRRPPFGIARSPLVARFQTICLIWPSSASYQSSVARHVDVDDVALLHFGGVSQQRARRRSARGARRTARSQIAAAARRRETTRSSCSAAPTRAARCPSAGPARR